MKKERGITLIALIITIIIMLILAGVVLNLTIGERGIFKTAQGAAKNYINASDKELAELDKFDNDIGEIINGLGQTGGNTDAGQTPEVSQPEIEIGEKIVSYKIKNNKENTIKKNFTQLSDLSGNGNIANLYNTDTAEKNDGIVFNGSSSYAQIDLQQNLTLPLTLEFVLTVPKEGNAMQILFANPTIAFGFTDEWHLLVADSSNNKTNYLELPSDFYDGNKKRIVVTYNSSTDYKAYVNNVELAKSSSTDFWMLPSVPYLGRRHNGTYFKGTIHEFRIYNKILSESEINGTIDRSNLILEYDIENEPNYTEEVGIIKDMTNNNNNAKGSNLHYNDKIDGIIFDGSSGYAQIDLQQNLTLPLTLEFVLTASNVGDVMQILFANPTIAFGFIDEWHLLVADSSNNNTNHLELPSDFYDGNKKHIVVTYNSSTDYKVYVNNVELTKSTSTSYWILPTASYLGRRHNGTYFKGTIHEFNIYKKELNENEIKMQYEKVKSNY